MSSENNIEQSQNSIQPSELSKSQSTISEETKILLNTLLKKRLNKKLLKLEQKFNEDKKLVKFIDKKFIDYISLLDSFTKEVYETIKEKAESSKKKHELIKENTKIKVHISKSFAPNKRLKISIKNDYSTNKTERKTHNITRTNFQTEIGKKTHVRPKTFKGQRMKIENTQSKKNLKQSQLDKNINIASPLKDEDNKAKTIIVCRTDKKNEKKGLHLNNENKSIKKKSKILKTELSGNILESGKHRYETEKNEKKTVNIIKDKLNKKGNEKKIIIKKINDKDKIIKKSPNKKEKKDDEKKEEKKEEKKKKIKMKKKRKLKKMKK